MEQIIKTGMIPGAADEGIRLSDGDGKPCSDFREIRTAVDRVARMEACFDALQQAVRRSEEMPEALLQMLISYYENGEWLRDYEMDEQNLLPKDLKRGVLAQDAVYDFLEQIRRAKLNNIM